VAEGRKRVPVLTGPDGCAGGSGRVSRQGVSLNGSRSAGAGPASAHHRCRHPALAGTDESRGGRPDRPAAAVEDRRAGRRERLARCAVVMTAQQQVSGARSASSGWHDHDHGRPGRAAAGTLGSAECPPGGGGRGPLRALRRADDSEMLGEVSVHGHQHQARLQQSPRAIAPRLAGPRTRAWRHRSHAAAPWREPVASPALPEPATSEPWTTRDSCG
jgi:hypothetical protein